MTGSMWTGRQLLVDRATLAAYFGVSERTVRRHCRVVAYRPQTGQRRGEGGKALYDAEAAAEALADVSTRTTVLARLRADQAGKEN